MFNYIGVKSLRKGRKELITYKLSKSSSKTENNRNYKGINFISKQDLAILLAIVRGTFNINGFRNKHLLKLLGFKRLHVHGLIKKNCRYLQILSYQNGKRNNHLQC